MKPIHYTIIAIILLTLAICFIGYRSCTSDSRQYNDTVIVRDTITIYDTIAYRKPIPKDSVVLRYDTLFLTVTDTDYVLLPIEQKVYKDSLYTAYISGYKPTLDSIFIYSKTRNITNTITIKPKKKRWVISAGINAGYNPIKNRFDTSVGINVGYKLWEF